VGLHGMEVHDSALADAGHFGDLFRHSPTLDQIWSKVPPRKADHWTFDRPSSTRSDRHSPAELKSNADNQSDAK